MKYVLVYAICVFLICFYVSMNQLGGFTYLSYQLDKSSLFEDYYVDPSSVDVSFKAGKKNLIYIFVESLEMSNASLGNGGGFEKSHIPNLEQLSLSNINFSNTDKLGGAMQVDGVGWTVAGMVAQTMGIPLKLRIQGNTYSGYSQLLPWAYSLGEILEQNGYNNYIMMGSDAAFGGRRELLTEHGNYDILDYYWALENLKISDDYFEWW